MKVNLLQRGMPISEGKKVENITAKVNAEQKALFEEVSRKEDRTVSYIVRELALRGLAQYQRDGRLRLTEDDETTLTGKPSTDFIFVEDRGPLDDDTLKTKKKLA